MSTTPATNALKAPANTTVLVTDPTTVEMLTTYREVDARSAIARGLVEYLEGQTIEVPGGRKLSIEHAYTNWPDAETEVEYPAITAVPEGQGTYDRSSLTPSIDPSHVIKAPDGRWPFKWAELAQEIRLELHTTDAAAREALTSMIEDAFSPVDWMMGFRLQLPFYFGTFATYEPLRVGYPDTAESVHERLRVTYFYVSAHVSVYRLQTLPKFKTETLLNVGLGVKPKGPTASS